MEARGVSNVIRLPTPSFPSTSPAEHYKRAARAPAAAMRRPPALADRASAASELVGRAVEVVVAEAASVDASVVVASALLVDREAASTADVLEAWALVP